MFDLLHLDGQSLIHQPYDTRRAALTHLGLDQLDRVDVPPSVTEVSGARLLEIAGLRRGSSRR